jgi:cobalamin biosynthesis protein CobD/CbiB
VADTWIGDGRRALNAADVERALVLYRVSGLLVMSVLAGLAATFLGN